MAIVKKEPKIREKAAENVNKKEPKEIKTKSPHGGDDNEPEIAVAHLAPKLFLQSYHPLLFKVGLRMSAGSITGSTQRCLSMLIAIKQMIHDHVTPENKDFARSFQAALNSAVKFLNQCRPMSVSMVNGIAFIKSHLSKISSTVPEEVARKQMKSLVEGFMTKEIELAVKAITKEGAKKIDHDGEVILTYGNPLLVKNILLKAFMDGKNFHVIVVDAKPRMVGKDLMKCLVSRGVKTTYIQINAIAHVMNKVTKVFLGAHAMLANGYAMASIGSAQIALVADSFNVPVLVCCETFKFSEKAILDSFALSKSGPLKPQEDFFNYGNTGKSKDSKGIKSKQDEVQKKEKKVNVLSLSYDLTPPSFITMIITEKSFLPASSVSAVIRNRTHELQ
ncbi:translation initiation factor eIF-2B subunit delta [Tetranychus urticae]|uniref:Translation initiation factor eIF2B subunit delta n=1 Tax=Tetranychus urticae TaxID=32264 RepID=T1KWD5_TETUR|nr:translation initiation factor eIF-2B subunit delta [Tetranychus urticae]